MKDLVNPLLWIIAVQLGAIVWLKRRPIAQPIPAVRRAWRIQALAVTALAIFSMPVTAHLLSRGLQVNAVESGSPTVLIVLGGGYRAGVSPDEDVLIEETSRRVAAAAVWWRSHSNATVIVSGAAPGIPGRDPDRMAQLMAEFAVLRGVPPDHIVLEPHAENTRDHPIQVLRLPGITRDTPVGIVTSAMHMRRAKKEFDRFFLHVSTRSVNVPWRFEARDVVPVPDALDQSMTWLREGVGILWYAIRASVSA